ncbi:MAG: hypothetical protein NC817_01415 [Candidatus Omnitrophica bacterium]|nr:hypothetical protein [Candidatus Omnitrophota bacterium]MCM8824128.1 hypothetical protein [Candidatus Omnitrophota bacterium]MCM8826596.1 hypothetical protein [Candidatus Omnitrophota bacterium]
MKKIIISLITYFSLFCFLPKADALVPVYNDLWDISQGASIIGKSKLYAGSDARNMLGGNSGRVEPGNTIFKNREKYGFKHWITWQVPNDITVGMIHLFAKHEPSSPYKKAFDWFGLYYSSDGNTWQEFYSQSVRIPYGGGSQGNELALEASFSPVTAKYFKAEFDKILQVKVQELLN